MPIPTAGYTLTRKNLGGMGKVAVHEAPDFGCRLSLTVTAATPDGESYLSLGGFQIGTATFSGRRALYIYAPSLSSPNLERTVWEGVQVEVAEESQVRSLVYNDESVLMGLPAFSSDELVAGGGIVSLDAGGKILCVDKGTPSETAQAMVGSKRLTIGRFGNVWAVSVHPVVSMP